MGNGVVEPFVGKNSLFEPYYLHFFYARNGARGTVLLAPFSDISVRRQISGPEEPSPWSLPWSLLGRWGLHPGAAFGYAGVYSIGLRSTPMNSRKSPMFLGVYREVLHSTPSNAS